MFGNFERIPCATIASAGKGCAGAVGRIVFEALRDQLDAIGGLQSLVEGLLRDHDITAYHFGVASEIPQYAVFGTAEVKNDRTDTFVVVVETVQMPQAKS